MTSLMYIVIFGILIIYSFIKWTFLYFSRLGVVYLEPNFSDVPGDKICKAYNHVKSKGAKFGGMFFLFKPTWIPTDLELLKNIVQTDFNHFVNRGVWKYQPRIFRNLLNMEDQEWKDMRNTVSPAFSSGKKKCLVTYCQFYLVTYCQFLFTLCVSLVLHNKRSDIFIKVA